MDDGEKRPPAHGELATEPYWPLEIVLQWLKLRNYRLLAEVNSRDDGRSIAELNATRAEGGLLAATIKRAIEALGPGDPNPRVTLLAALRRGAVKARRFSSLNESLPIKAIEWGGGPHKGGLRIYFEDGRGPPYAALAPKGTRIERVLIDRASLLSAFPAVDEAEAHAIAPTIAEMAVGPLTEPPTGPESLAIDAIRWIMGRAPGNEISWEAAHSAFREMWKKDQLPMFGYAVLEDRKRGKLVAISPVNMVRPWRIYPGLAPGGLFADEPPPRNEGYLGRVLFDQREEDFTGVIVRSSDLLVKFPPLLDPNRRLPSETRTDSKSISLHELIRNIADELSPENKPHAMRQKVFYERIGDRLKLDGATAGVTTIKDALRDTRHLQRPKRRSR